MNVRHLPVIQQWDCHACTHCCRHYDVPVSAEEREKITALGWSSSELGGLAPFVRQGWWSGEYCLNRRPRGECVFLSLDNRCLLHEKHGPDAKPLGCRLYPFVLVPAGDHWRLSLRFGCPSVANNHGRVITDHAAELQRLAALYGQHQAGEAVPPPPLQGNQVLPWRDLWRLTRGILRLFDQANQPLQWRWRLCLGVVEQCRQARLDALTDSRLEEFLDLITPTVAAELSVRLEDLPPPSWIGRVLFRQLASVYARRDRGPNQGPAARSRLGLLLAGWKFAWGSGQLPLVNRLLDGLTFAGLEQPAGPLGAEVEQLLTRYYHVKIAALQFCGVRNFGLGFWEGLEALALTFPVILWLTRGLAGKNLSRLQAAALATGIVDDGFGFNAVLATRRLRFAHHLLARQGELPRLIAWYSR